MGKPIGTLKGYQLGDPTPNKDSGRPSRHLFVGATLPLFCRVSFEGTNWSRLDDFTKMAKSGSHGPENPKKQFCLNSRENSAQFGKKFDFFDVGRFSVNFRPDNRLGVGWTISVKWPKVGPTGPKINFFFFF